MSEQPPQNSEAHPLDNVPGCGVAAYGILLIVFFFVGVAGMALSSATLMQASSSTGPSRLLAGGNVSVWRLQPMRDAQVLALTEVPAVWHDESASGDGTDACAMTEDALVRVEAEQGYEVAYTDITRVDIIEEGEFVIVETVNREGSALRCFFRQDEGGEKMARMLRSEAGLVGRYRDDGDQ